MIRGDDPITDHATDLLGRAGLAAVIAGEIRDVDATAGFVVGILGPWGSGKTSLINLVAEELGRAGDEADEQPAIPVLRFNPWMFSGANQLVERFFAELAAQLGSDPDRFRDLAGKFARYGKLVSPLKVVPVVGQVVGGIQEAGEALKEFADASRGGVAEQRRELEEALAALDAPTLVVVDDVDRLTVSEIRDVFKLVRLTASFPKLVYLVAFDRARVERALDEDGLSGRDYLEKIIQLIFDVPAIPPDVLSGQVVAAVTEALDPDGEGLPWDPRRGDDVLAEVVFPLFTSMRDVRRFAASVRGTARSVEGRVSLVDLLGLEAVRVFLPDVFARVVRGQDALTAFEGMPWEGRTEKARKRQFKDLLKLAKDAKLVAEAMICRLFPAAVRHVSSQRPSRTDSAKWLRERRVAHPAVLAYYLERVAGRQLEGMWDAEQVLPLLADQDRFVGYLRDKDPATWTHIIKSLSILADGIPPDAVVPVTVGLLQLLAEDAEARHRPFEPSARGAAHWLIRRMVAQLETPTEREAAIREAFARTESLWGKLELLRLIGRQDDELSADLVGEALLDELGADLRGRVRAADPERLIGEREPLRILEWTADTAGEDDLRFGFPTGTDVDCEFLKRAPFREATRFSGSRAVSVRTLLPWRALVDVCGGEGEVRNIAQRCRALDDESLADALALIEEYLGGYRPRYGLPEE